MNRTLQMFIITMAALVLSACGGDNNTASAPSADKQQGVEEAAEEAADSLIVNPGEIKSEDN